MLESCDFPQVQRPSRPVFAHNNSEIIWALVFFPKTARSGGSQAMHDSFARPVAIEEKTPAVPAAHRAGGSYKLRRLDANFLVVLKPRNDLSGLSGHVRNIAPFSLFSDQLDPC